MIERWITGRIFDRISHAPVVALLGARQVGKTTLARKIAEDTGAAYLDLENHQDLAKLTDPYDYLSVHHGKLVILDEIHRIPEIFGVLRGVVDKGRQEGRASGQFLILGSASMELLHKSAQSLAGRIHHLKMSGINALEVAEHGTRELWLRGGFPPSFFAADDARSSIERSSLIDTYLERDIPQLGLSFPASQLRRLWTMLAHNQGQTVNISTLASNFEIEGKVISQWIDTLAGLMLVRHLEPWHTNVKKRLVKSPRLYVRDSGLLHALLNIRSHDDLLGHPVLGKSWEGFVIENICSVLPEYAQTYFYRTSAGAEIDLVVSLSASDNWAIEIKRGMAPKLDRHFGRTCEDVRATRKFVVYGGDEEFGIGDGVTVLSLPKLMRRLVESLPIP